MSEVRIDKGHINDEERGCDGQWYFTGERERRDAWGRPNNGGDYQWWVAVCNAFGPGECTAKALVVEQVMLGKLTEMMEDDVGGRQ